VPACRRCEGVRPGRAIDAVAVAARQGRAAGVEACGCPTRFPDHHFWGEYPIERTLQPRRVGRGCHISAQRLAPGVDTSVSAAGANELDRVAEHLFHCGCQFAAHGAQSWLGRKPVEARAQVGDEQPQPPGSRCLAAQLPCWLAQLGGLLQIFCWLAQLSPQTSSIRAMGALSPGRGPSLRMRV
jgi:hypothetical protein